MKTAGSKPNELPKPLWLLAELTYKCPLQCPYCSNPVDFANCKGELTTEDWLRVFREARAMGATQLGLSGGEPLVRRDLEVLITEARKLGYYTNLITSGVGMDEARIKAFKAAGLDHIQISFQASTQELNNYIAGTDAFQHKLKMARLVKHYGYPMVLCFVLHRENEDQVEQILDMAIALDADALDRQHMAFIASVGGNGFDGVSGFGSNRLFIAIGTEQADAEAGTRERMTPDQVLREP